MKKLNLLLLVFFAAFIVSKTVGQGITGSKHDFSGQTAWNPSGEICIVCHTPHNADATIADAPLWNHATTTFDYTSFIYTSNTLNAVVGVPDGSSKLCLSCHDGTVAVDNFGGVTTGTNFIGTINPNASLGTNLKNDHPISFNYDAAQALDNEIRVSATETPSPATGTITQVYLMNGQVQCGSCHDVHNSTGVPKLLKVANTKSQLCLDCHVK